LPLRSLRPSARGRPSQFTELNAIGAPPRETRIRYFWVRLAVVAVLYFAAARLGLALAFTTPQVSAFWPPAGVALVALLLLGDRYWPAVYLGAFAINALADEQLLVALLIGVGNTVTGLVGARVLRAVQFETALERTRDVLGLITVAIGSTLISASVGTASLSAGGHVRWSEYASVWRVWWVGDSLGVLIVAPLLLTWARNLHMSWSTTQRVELAAYMASVVLVGLVVFVIPFGGGPLLYPRAYVAFPLLAWAGLRFGPRETALGTATVSLMAIWGTIHGHGPFGVGPSDGRLILLDMFIATIGCTGLLLGALIAERQGARVAARVTAGLLEAISEHAPAVIYVKDLVGRYLMVNRRYAEVTGLGQSAVIGKTDYELFCPEQAECFVAMDQRVIRAGHALTEEQVAVVAGEPRNYISVKCPLLDEADEPYAVIGISTDVTDLHNAQARLRQAYEELEGRVRERTVELATAVEELRQRNRDKETLLREVHHRVKNNLQVVSSLLSLQAQGHAEPHLISFAEDCKARVRSMALVHEQLYQSKDLQGVPLAVYVRTLVEGLMQGRSSSASRITCHVDVPDQTLPVDQAIPCGLIINELVTNAFKHAFPADHSGRVTLSVSDSDANHIELRITDDGIGFSEDVEPSRAGGFGLRLVAMLADQLDATLTFERHSGTSVRIRFPRNPAA
jgi:PAS domain S-box-containing protein